MSPQTSLVSPGAAGPPARDQTLGAKRVLITRTKASEGIGACRQGSVLAPIALSLLKGVRRNTPVFLVEDTIGLGQASAKCNEKPILRHMMVHRDNTVSIVSQPAPYQRGTGTTGRRWSNARTRDIK